MAKNNKIDVSYFQDEDLDNTASFVDLMSRSERRKREKVKEENRQKELQEILFKEEQEKAKNKKRDLKRKEKLNKIAKSSDDEPKVQKINTKKYQSEVIYPPDKISNTARFKNFSDEVKTSIYDNVEQNISNSKEKTKYGIGNLIMNGIFIIASLVFYIYSILFTNIQSDETNLLIGGIIILTMIALFCLSVICGKVLYYILSILNYLIFIGFVAFNLLLVIKL